MTEGREARRSPKKFDGIFCKGCGSKIKYDKGRGKYYLAE